MITHFPPIDGSSGVVVGDIPFYLAVAQGNVSGYSNVSKFGYNSSIGSSSYESIWETGGVYSFMSTADQLEVVSADANDTSVGTGARTVELQGLDSSYDLLTETVTMNGTTAVTTTGSFLRIFRARVLTAGTGEVNAGAITITDQDTSTTRATISAGQGQTLMSVYTVPNGKTAYIVKINVSSGKDQEIKFRLRTNDRTVTNGAWQIKEFIDTRGGFTPWDKLAINKVTQKTDIDLQAIGQSTTSAAGGFELIIVDN